MYNRFKSGMFIPSRITKYEKEKWYATLSYFLLLVIIATIPFLCSIKNYDAIDYAYRTEFREMFKNEDIEFRINNYELQELTPEATDTYYFYTYFEIKFDESLLVENYTQDTTNYTLTKIVFCKDGVVIDKTLVKNKTFKYSEYSEYLSDGLDFSSQKDYNFWEKVFTIANAEYGKMHDDLLKYYIIENVVANVGQIIIFALILAFFQKLFSYGLVNKKFRQHLNSSIYILTPYIVFSTLSSLYALSLLSLVGLCITAIYSYKINQRK